MSTDQFTVIKNLQFLLKHKDAEIDRLKAENERLRDEGSFDNLSPRIIAKQVIQINEQRKLIGELADALSHYALLNDFEKSLIQRAREVTNGR